MDFGTDPERPPNTLSNVSYIMDRLSTIVNFRILSIPRSSAVIYSSNAHRNVISAPGQFLQYR